MDHTPAAFAEPVNPNNMQVIDREGQFWFTGEDIGRQLGYEYPRESIANILHALSVTMRPMHITENLELDIQAKDGFSCLFQALAKAVAEL